MTELAIDVLYGAASAAVGAFVVWICIRHRTLSMERSDTFGDDRMGDERAGDERAGDDRAGDERAGDDRAGGLLTSGSLACGNDDRQVAAEHCTSHAGHFRGGERGEASRAADEGPFGELPPAVAPARAYVSLCGPEVEQMRGPSEDESGFENLIGRKEFCNAVRQRLAERKRGGSTFSVVLTAVRGSEPHTNLPGLGKTNPVSKAVVRSMLAVVREMDFATQYSQNRFAFLLFGAGKNEAASAWTRIQEAIEAAYGSGRFGPEFMPTAGVAEASQEDDLVRLLARVEEAFEQATRADGHGLWYHNGQWAEPLATAILSRT